MKIHSKASFASFALFALLIIYVRPLDGTDTVEPGTFWSTLGNKVAQKAAKKTVIKLAKVGAAWFLRELEIKAIKQLIDEKYFDEMDDIEKEKIFKVGFMLNATEWLYTHNYQCAMQDTNIMLAFTVGKPDIVLPKEWILTFFKV